MVGYTTVTPRERYMNPLAHIYKYTERATQAHAHSLEGHTLTCIHTCTSTHAHIYPHVHATHTYTHNTHTPQTHTSHIHRGKLTYTLYILTFTEKRERNRRRM